MSYYKCHETRGICRANKKGFCVALDEPPARACPFYKTETEWLKEVVMLKLKGHQIGYLMREDLIEEEI